MELIREYHEVIDGKEYIVRERRYPEYFNSVVTTMEPVRTPEQWAAWEKRVDAALQRFGKYIIDTFGMERFLEIFPQEGHDKSRDSDEN